MLEKQDVQILESSLEQNVNDDELDHILHACTKYAYGVHAYDKAAVETLWFKFLRNFDN